MDGTGDGPGWEEDPAAAPSRSVGDPREMPKGRGGDKNRKEVESGGGTDGAGDERARKQEAVVAPSAKKRKILADGGGMDGQVPPPNNSVGGPSLRKLRGMMKVKGKRSSGEGSGGGGSARDEPVKVKEEDRAVALSMGKLTEMPKSTGAGKEEAGSGTSGAGDEPAWKEEVVAPTAKKRKILADGGGMDGQVPPPNNSVGGPSLRKLRGMMKVKGKRSSGEGSGGGGSARDEPVKVKEEDRAVALSMGKLTEMPKSIGAGKEEAGSGTSGAGDEPAWKEEVVAPTAKKQKILLPDDQVLKKASPAMKMTPSVAVAHTPGMPQRYASLLRNITFLLSCEDRGQAYECTSDRIRTFLKWRGCDFCLFFEWLDKGRGMLCHMFNTLTGTRGAFYVNPAFAYEILEVKAKSIALVFSSSFCCDEKWAAVKDMLVAIFHPKEEEVPEAPDHLYVFTRTEDHVYMRNMKIDRSPAMDSSENTFALTEVGPSFGLKLLEIQGIPDRVYDVSQNKIETNMILSSTLYYSVPPDKQGSCTAHNVSLSGKSYIILLENGPKLSEFEGFNLSLGEYLSKEPFVKIKKIIGSVTDEESAFVRNIGKYIIRSLLAELSDLFASSKCIAKTEDLLLHFFNILLKGSTVKFFGIKIVKFEEALARWNVAQIVELISQCFPAGQIPSDLKDLLVFLLEDPLNNLEIAKDSCDLYSARERRELLVRLYTEYMTNVKHQVPDRDDFFDNCPYLGTWMNIVKSNTYLKKSANLESKRVKLIVKGVEKRKAGRSDKERAGAEGELQFGFMRNSNVHIPEKAQKDGLKPFRLTWSDYILTASFRKYLVFIQRKMAPYLKSKGDRSRQN